MATQIFPLEVWTSQITQASIPANENALRVQVLEQAAISILSAQPGSPVEDDVYIIGPAPTGAQWSTFAEHDVVIYKGGTWLAYAPFEGWVKAIADVLHFYDGQDWTLVNSATMEFAANQSNTVSFTLALSDAGKFINANHATVPIVITVPPNSSVAFPDATEIHVRWSGVAAVSIAAGAGVTIQCPVSQSLNLRERYAVATLKKVDTDTWALFGMLGDA